MGYAESVTPRTSSFDISCSVLDIPFFRPSMVQPRFHWRMRPTNLRRPRISDNWNIEYPTRNVECRRTECSRRVQSKWELPRLHRHQPLVRRLAEIVTTRCAAGCYTCVADAEAVRRRGAIECCMSGWLEPPHRTGCTASFRRSGP